MLVTLKIAALVATMIAPRLEPFALISQETTWDAKCTLNGPSSEDGAYLCASRDRIRARLSDLSWCFIDHEGFYDREWVPCEAFYENE